MEWSPFFSVVLLPIKVKGKFFPVQVVKASRGTTPLIPNLGTRRRRVVNLVLLPLYSRGSTDPYPLNKMLGGSPDTSGIFWKIELLFLSELEHRTVQPVA
jgi:hypothetical protein